MYAIYICVLHDHFHDACAKSKWLIYLWVLTFSDVFPQISTVESKLTLVY